METGLCLDGTPEVTPECSVHLQQDPKDVEGVVRSVLDCVQKRSQGLESRLREELAATNLVDFSNLKAYVSD